MRRENPLLDHHRAEAERELGNRSTRGDTDRPGAATGRMTGMVEPEYLAWGPPDEHGGGVCDILATLGSVEREYAHLRREQGRVDEAVRGTIRVEGEDAADFLDRMLTQKLAGFGPGDAAATFLVDRKGRIQADLLLAGTPDGIFIDVDVHQVAEVVAILEGFLFSEDVRLEDVTARWHRLSVHGPGAPNLFEPLDSMHAATVELDGRPVHVVRRDRIGAPGFDLFELSAAASRACPTQEV